MAHIEKTTSLLSPLHGRWAQTSPWEDGLDMTVFCHTFLRSMQVNNWKGKISLEFILSYRGLWDTMWLLEIGRGSSTRATDAFITGPSLQPLTKYFIWQKKLPKDYQIGYLPFGNSLWHGGSWGHSFCPGKIPRRKDRKETFVVWFSCHVNDSTTLSDITFNSAPFQYSSRCYLDSNKQSWLSTAPAKSSLTTWLT